MVDRPRQAGGGAIQILVATAVAGGSGYILTVFAGVRLGVEGYTAFAVFWSALYLLISAVSGVQQEVTRAAGPATPGEVRRPVARNFALGVSVVVFATIILTSLIWAPIVFGGLAWELVVPLGVAVASYVVVAVLAGVLYGLQRWRLIAALIVIDGVLRLLLAVGALMVTGDMALVAWAISVPFVLAPIAVWLVARRGLTGRFRLDVGYHALTWNVARTVVAAAATGVLISGFPLLLGATSADDPETDVAALVFASNLTRAPIVIVVLALQSYLIVRFRARSDRATRELGMVITIIVAGAAVLTLAASLLGEWAFRTFFGPEFVLDPLVLALLVGSAAAVAAVCASGPFVLARGLHSLYTAGWIAAALATLGPLLIPMELTERALLALWLGPLVGLTVHLVGVAILPAAGASAGDTSAARIDDRSAREGREPLE